MLLSGRRVLFNNVYKERYTAMNGLQPTLTACRFTMLPACVFVTQDTVRYPRRSFCSESLFMILTFRDKRHLWPEIPPHVNNYDGVPKKKPQNKYKNITSSKTFQSLSSDFWLLGSRFLRTVFENIAGSWGMMERRLRRSCKPKAPMEMPSIRISPLGSVMRYIDEMRDDLPAPVRPTIPILGKEKKWHRNKKRKVRIIMEKDREGQQ